MDDQKPENPVPQPTTQTPPPPAAYNPNQIYPEAVDAPSAAGTPKLSTDFDTKSTDRAPIAVIIISGLIMLQSISGILAGLSHKAELNVIIYSLQFILGLGLLTLHEIARLIYVWIGIISLCLEIPGLLFTSALSHSGLLLFIVWVSVAIQIAVLLYLTRPSVKDHFN